MKAVVALLVVLVAVAAAQHLSASEMDALRAESASLPMEKSYINEVEYVEQLESAPHPSLVPHHFLEAEAARRRKSGGRKSGGHKRGGRKSGGRKAARRAKKAKKAVKRANKKATKKAAKKANRKSARKVSKYASKIKSLTARAKKGDKKAAAKLKKLQAKMKAEVSKMSGKAKKIGKMILKKNAKKAKKANKAAKNKSHKKHKLARKLKRSQKKAQKKLNKKAKKTSKKVRDAMDKLRHLSTSMRSLKILMTRINKQVGTLIPENRIRKYELEDPSKVSHSQAGNLKAKESKLVNPYKKNQNNEESYSNSVIPKGTKVITKPDDMAVQELAIKQKTLSKFTKKLAAKDDISLV